MFSSEIMQNFYIGLEIMLYAMGGVFAVLFLFYLIIKYMVKIANKFQKNTDDEA